MSKIPADTLKVVLELRSENGLPATEEAVYADLAKSKAKWVLEETPRYRQAGRSPLYVSGKYLSAYGTDPATGEADTKTKEKPAAKREARASSTFVGNGKAVDETAFYKVLHGKGFAVKISQNLLNGELETQIPPAISKLELQFGVIPANASAIHVTQTSPQIQVAMPLDKFLEIAGIKPV
ncbi:hypothetical protein KBB96_04935 [Luteolibacter ambystomatis]|uniref:Uncharacterized protein n=1 Tax=Luteolibacter ambystomatis TaxID=2824561 RepID=A0A975PFU8_9BACT|nr:hypothetical protein [Luteolibacter ambystomatis]QUE52238.1 hypothetical protein KBB96_04935 [Luteolibacter ambystomatis]